MEKADGTLYDWNKTNHSLEEWNNMLFQIMAGLAALQSEKLQIFHNDIKSQNILYHNVKKGGYWEYNIGEDVYYLPNLGFIAIIADYGISTTFNYSIKYQSPKTRRLGFRGLIRDDHNEHCGLVLCNRSNNNCIDTNTKVIAEIEPYPELNKYLSRKPSNDNYDYNIRQRNIRYNGLLYYDKCSSKIPDLNVKIIPSKFENRISKNDILSKNILQSSMYPPIEFVFDTQDVIRMFSSGKRVTQAGSHPGMNHFIKGLEKYATKDSVISLKKSKCFARDFIKEFFHDNYSHKPNSKRIGSYYIL